MSGPLAGYKVLDLTMYLAGPFCSMLFGDMGADVIKIENSGSRDPMRGAGPPFIGGESGYYMFVNRNKRSLAADLKTPEGRQIFFKLVETADVVIENFRPGVMDKLGIGYDQLKDINPRLVFGSVSGFGEAGPLSHLPGFDHIMQAYSGWMSITGTADSGPLRTGPSVGDILGAWSATMAICFALIGRGTTGVGQKVSTSLLDALVSTLLPQAVNYLVGGELPKPTGNLHPIIVPFGTFSAADGMINVAVGTGRQWNDLCVAMGRPELADHPNYASMEDRSTRRDEVHRALSDALRGETVATWVQRFNTAGIPCAPVNNIQQVLENEQVKFNQALVELCHPTAGVMKVLNNAFKMEQRPVREWLHPPRFGEHTRAVLEEVGYQAAEIDKLIEAKVLYSMEGTS